MTAQVHETAVVEEGAEVGDGTRIWHFAHVREGARIGADCNVGKDVYVDAGVVVGDGCKIQNGANLYRGLVVEDRVFIGPHAQFTNDMIPRAELWDDDRLEETLVREGASIGVNATILCDLQIGRYAMVGAAALVTRDVPDHGLVVGQPARLVGFVCTCGRRLEGEGDPAGKGRRFTCSCGEATTIPEDDLAKLEEAA